MVPRGTVSFVFPRVRTREKTKLTSFPIFMIPSEFLFLIEVIKAYYYISYHVLQNICKLRLTHSAGLTIVNKDVLPSLVFFVIAI